MNKAEEIANWLLTGEVEEIDLFEAAELIRQQAEQISNLQQWQRRQLDVIEALQSTVNSNKEVIADWEAEVKSVREMNTICLRSNRQQQAEIEALKEALSMKVILNEHAQQSMKETKELLK